jgi:hypothetical protein
MKLAQQVIELVEGPVPTDKKRVELTLLSIAKNHKTHNMSDKEAKSFVSWLKTKRKESFDDLIGASDEDISDRFNTLLELYKMKTNESKSISKDGETSYAYKGYKLNLIETNGDGKWYNVWKGDIKHNQDRTLTTLAKAKKFVDNLDKIPESTGSYGNYQTGITKADSLEELLEKARRYFRTDAVVFKVSGKDEWSVEVRGKENRAVKVFKMFNNYELSQK